MIDANLRKRIIAMHVKSLNDRGFTKITVENIFTIPLYNDIFEDALQDTLRDTPKGHVRTEIEELLKEFE